MYDQERRRLGIKARFITISMKHPSFPVFGLTPIPNTNATHNMAYIMRLEHANMQYDLSMQTCKGQMCKHAISILACTML